jgi:hypothetical protein
MASKTLTEKLWNLLQGSGKLRLFISYDENNPTNDACIWRPHNQDLLTFRSSFLDQKFPTPLNEFGSMSSVQKDVYVFPMMKQAICRYLSLFDASGCSLLTSFCEANCSNLSRTT